MFPIPSQTRQAVLIASGGQTTFGPFDFILFDPDDIQVRTMAPASEAFALVSKDNYTVNLAAPATRWPGPFTLTLDAGLSAGTMIWIKGARLGSRQTNVTQGGVVKSVPLEKELDTQTATLQELRRDIDAIFAGGAQHDLIASGIANNSTAPGGTVADALGGLDTRETASELHIETLQTSVDQLVAVIANYSSALAVTSAFIGEGAAFLRTAGYAVPGDWGGALYKKVASEPPHADKIQSADGAWWQIADPVLDVRMFGAKGDGTTDDTVALNAWYDALISNGADVRVGRISPGRFKFTTALVWAGKDNISIVGVGRGASVLVYAGANTTNDIITYGDYAVDNYTNNLLADFTVTSTTTMTGGYALRLKGFSSSIISRVNMDGQHGAGKLWHGIYFDACQVVRYDNFESSTQRDNVSIAGTVGAGAKAEVFVKDGWIVGIHALSVGVRVGGAFGGAYIDYISVSGLMSTAFTEDQTLKAETNREIFLSNCLGDAGMTYSLLVNNATAAGTTFQYTDCTFYSQVRLQAGASTNHQFNGCRFSNNLGGDCLRVDDTMLVQLDGCFLINSLSGYGFRATVAHNVYFGSTLLASNALGDFDPAHPPKYRVGPISGSTAGEIAAALNGATLTKVANYTVLAADYGALIKCSGTFTLAFTAAATLGDKWRCMVRNTGSGVITLDPNAAETINTFATYPLYPGESAVVVCDGAALHTVGKLDAIKSACAIYMAAGTQSITASTFTKVNFDTALFDARSDFDLVNHRFKPTVPGYYQVNCSISAYTSTAPTRLLIALYKNGAQYNYALDLPVASGIASGSGNTVVYLNGTTDYVEAFVLIAATTAQVVGGATVSQFSAFLIREG